MNRPGDAETLVAARSALLDALEALADQRNALVLVGAQAIYLHTGAAPVALGEATKDTDLAVDPRALEDDPLLEEAMQHAGFHRNLTDPQPGSWLSARGIPVDLLVPAALAGRRSAWRAHSAAQPPSNAPHARPRGGGRRPCTDDDHLA
jgi:hypothetical protein